MMAVRRLVLLGAAATAASVGAQEAKMPVTQPWEVPGMKEMIQSASEQADALKKQAEKEAREQLKSAQATAETSLADAQKQAEQSLADAQKQATYSLSSAQAQAQDAAKSVVPNNLPVMQQMPSTDGLLGDLMEQARDTMKTAKESLKESMDTAKESMKEAQASYHEAKQEAKQQLKEMEQSAQEEAAGLKQDASKMKEKAKKKAKDYYSGSFVADKMDFAQYKLDEFKSLQEPSDVQGKFLSPTGPKIAAVGEPKGFTRSRMQAPAQIPVLEGIMAMAAAVAVGMVAWQHTRSRRHSRVEGEDEAFSAETALIYERRPQE